MVKYISGGSNGIGASQSAEYNFQKSQVVPEIAAIKRQAAYLDSAEYKIIKAYAEVGKVPPDEVLAQVRGK